jgi:uncharacterized protein with FMN-binding domain
MDIQQRSYTAMNPQSNNRKLLAVLGLVVIVAAIGATVWATRRSSNDTAASSSSPTAQTSTEQPTAAAATPSSYKDGSYKATGTYSSPGGRESMGVTVVIKNGKVSDSSLKLDPSGPTAHEYQSQFEAGYKSQVTGRSLDEINLSRVSGSSLTSQGFNAALEQIKQQAAS